MIVSSILRALGWLALGILFGLGLIWLILVSPAIFVQHNSHVTVSDVLHDEFVTFLGLALAGGAFSDYLLSVNFKGYAKLIAGLLVLVGCITVYLIFNPSAEVYDNAKRNFTVGFCIGAFIFCVCLKAVIFYKELFAHKKLKRRL